MAQSPSDDLFPAVFQYRRGRLIEATWRRVTAAYYGAITYLDQQLGRVLQALEETRAVGEYARGLLIRSWGIDGCTGDVRQIYLV